MKRLLRLQRIFLFVSLGWLLCANPMEAQGELENTGDKPIVILGASILNADGDAWLRGYALRIENGQIVEVVPDTKVEWSRDLNYVLCPDAYVIPGLIDLHTHLLLHPYNEASWETQVLKEPLELRVARAVSAAQATLEAGFTCIRELGTEGAGFADVGLKQAVNEGVIVGPRLYVSTRAIVATGAYGPGGFDPRWQIPKGAQVADGVDGVRRATREQIAAGADWIKVYADYRRRPGDASTPTFSLEELEAIVHEATSAGIPVAAHASTPEGIRRAVLAGVRTIEHGTGATPEVLELMAQRKVVLCPTLAAGESVSRYAGWEPGTAEPARIRQARSMFQEALRQGVEIACGSDAGVLSHGRNAWELELMVNYGMSNQQALASATHIAAKVLGAAEQWGRIAPGFQADVVLLRKDPLTDIQALYDPLLVMQEGRIVVDRRYDIKPELREQLIALGNQFLNFYGNKEYEKLEEIFAEHCVITIHRLDADETSVLDGHEFLKGLQENPPSFEVFEEWLTDSITVHVDGRLAVLWAPFVLEVDGRRAIGTDVFHLVQTETGWKFAQLSFTNRAVAGPPESESQTKVQHRIRGRLQVGRAPHQIVFSADGSQAFLAAAGSDRVAQIDVAQMSLVRDLRFPDTPLGVQLLDDGQALAVTAFQGTELRKISLEDAKVLNKLEVGKGASLLTPTASGFLLLSVEDENRLFVIDATQFKIEATFKTGERPFPAASDSVASLAFVPCYDSGWVQAFDIKEWGAPYTVPVGKNPSGGVVLPGDQEYAVAVRGENKIALINTSTFRVEAEIMEGIGESPFSVVLSADEKFAYVNNTGSHDISVIDLATKTVVERVSVGEIPIVMAVHPQSGDLWIACEGSHEVVILEASIEEV